VPNEKDVPPMKVCAIIVTYNIGAGILKCFDSIEGQVNEVVIIDNGSDKNTIDVLKGLERQTNLRIFYNDENMGIAAAFNTGITYALKKGYDWVLTLDHDSIATPDMVQDLLEAYDFLKSKGQNSKVGILCPVPYDINAKIYLRREMKSTDDIVNVKMAISSGSLTSRNVFKDIGLFNEELFLYYVDDDFCLRLRKAGYKIFLVKRAILLHAEGRREFKRLLWKSVPFNNYSATANYYVFRNGIFILKKHMLFDGSYMMIIMLRMTADLVRIVLFSNDKLNNIKQSLTGLGHGIIGKYGRKP
jgi:rhamnosyltransferase